MRIGVFVGYWPWFGPDEQVQLAVLADEQGLDSVWVAEAWGQDAVSVLGLLAGKTSRIGLGSALMQIPARKPTATAMAAASIDVISGGRFRLGLGLSGPQVSEGWYGVPFGRGLSRTREYVDVVRRALDRERIEMPLEIDPAHPATGLGKPLKLLAQPVQDHLPIYLGATGPKSIALTAEIADGWLPFVIEKSMLAEITPPTDRPFDIAACLPVAVDEDVAAARDAVRPWLAFYFGAMGTPGKNFYVELADRHGHGGAARLCQERWLERDPAGAAAALTDELVDAAALASRPADLGARVAEYADAGATTLIALPCGDRRTTVQELARVHAAA
ncbi:MAG: class flavin-dependent oxidoreductase [Solirubrobacterales bacterium]|jgi:F420-dependent oxidoreductase-like protein|nr:class flavin-dependent oxidoreductase [Solirubrobacterales bacterium]